MAVSAACSRLFECMQTLREQVCAAHRMMSIPEFAVIAICSAESRRPEFHTQPEVFVVLVEYASWSPPAPYSCSRYYSGRVVRIGFSNVIRFALSQELINTCFLGACFLDAIWCCCPCGTGCSIAQHWTCDLVHVRGKHNRGWLGGWLVCVCVAVSLSVCLPVHLPV